MFRAELAQDGSVGSFASLLALPLARAHAHQTPFLSGKLYSVGGSIDHEVQPEVFIGTLE